MRGLVWVFQPLFRKLRKEGVLVLTLEKQKAARVSKPRHTLANPGARFLLTIVWKIATWERRPQSCHLRLTQRKGKERR